jgi:hypothetical protein
VADGAVDARILAVREGDDSARRFKIHPARREQKFTWTATINPQVNCEARLALIPLVWNGYQFNHSDDPIVFGPTEQINQNQVTRIGALLQPSFIGAEATHFQPAIYLTAFGGTALNYGDVVYVDNALLSGYELYSTEYQDGSMLWNTWTGDPDASSSYCYGPARQIEVEVKDQIDFTSFNASMAKFSVVFNSPGPFWTDPIRLEQIYAIGRSGSIVDIKHLEGSTAPMLGARLEVAGAISPFTLTDMGSGAWIHIDHVFSDDDVCIIENATFKIVDKYGKSMISTMTHGGSGYLLPLTLEADQEWPRVMVTAHNIGHGASLTVRAARKFFIA